MDQILFLLKKYSWLAALFILGAAVVMLYTYIYPITLPQPPKSDPVILLVFNGDHDIEAENLLASITKNAPQLRKSVVICVSDEKSKAFALNHKLAYFVLDNISDSGGFMTYAMNRMTQRKLEAIVYLLQRDKSVLYVDTDTVFLGNPLSNIDRRYDFNIQIESCHGPYNIHNLCTGIMYVNPKPKTIKFFQQAIKKMQDRNFKNFADQDAINLLVGRQMSVFNMKFWDKITVTTLDICKFPNGCRYFSATEPKCMQSDALIVHNNYLQGIENKMQRFKEHSLIFIE